MYMYVARLVRNYMYIVFAPIACFRIKGHEAVRLGTESHAGNLSWRIRVVCVGGRWHSIVTCLIITCGSSSGCDRGGGLDGERVLEGRVAGIRLLTCTAEGRKRI